MVHQEKGDTMCGASGAQDALGVLDADFISGAHLDVQMSIGGSCTHGQEH